MAYFALMYELVDDYLARRSAFRQEHLSLATAAQERGEIVMAGAFSDPPDRALLIFRAADRGVVRAERPVRAAWVGEALGSSPVDGGDRRF